MVGFIDRLFDSVNSTQDRPDETVPKSWGSAPATPVVDDTVQDEQPDKPLELPTLDDGFVWRIKPLTSDRRREFTAGRYRYAPRGETSGPNPDNDPLVNQFGIMTSENDEKKIPVKGDHFEMFEAWSFLPKTYTKATLEEHARIVYKKWTDLREQERIRAEEADRAEALRKQKEEATAELERLVNGT